ncbi:MAG: hypothetical protein AAGI66_02040 [Cyanobacteria bacterium P01_H01_bin.74]
MSIAPLAPSISNKQTTSQLQLISFDASATGIKEALSVGDIIQCLLQSVEGADKAGRQKVENLMVQIGLPAVKFLLEALVAESLVVQSVCYMALLRIGQPAVKSIKIFLKQGPEKNTWVKNMWVMNQLCNDLQVYDVQVNPVQGVMKPLATCP